MLTIAWLHPLQEVEAALHIKFDEDPLQVRFYGVQADVQVRGDLLARAPLYAGIDNLPLTLTKLNWIAHRDFLVAEYQNHQDLTVTH